MTFSIATKKDLKKIQNLLKINDLCYSDIGEQPTKDFIVVKSNSDQIIGCIGLEKYGSEGLLRSLAVRVEFRMKGYGKQLCHQLLSYATKNGGKTLNLLTMTAEKYFEKMGFKRRDRKST